MAAYSLADRFPRNPPCYRIHDPGAYANNLYRQVKPNKAGFMSNTPRNTASGNRIYTDKLYDSSVPHKIQNISSFKSRKPRFPYEAFSKEDLEKLLCRCGVAVCECPVQDESEEYICQAKVRRRLFKGPPPHSQMGSGITAPSKRHLGYEVCYDGSIKQIVKVVSDCPGFYDARVHESTEFYHGWKWSKWTSKRATKKPDPGLGPAYYNLEKEPTDFERCMEKVREHKRKTSKQLRYIEQVQNLNILEGFPGPSDYDPKLPKGTDLQSTTAKAKRFLKLQYDIKPGPTTYYIRRSFEPPEKHTCQAKLPDPAPFGLKAKRFRYKHNTGPGPADYVMGKICNHLHCAKAGFNSSTPRFKPTLLPDYYYESPIDEEYDNDDKQKECPKLTSAFKSKTVRMKPLKKNYDEPSPADIMLTKNITERTPLMQYLAPFNSSEGRFQPWNDWLPVFQKYSTPGPCYYNLTRHKCLPAVTRGPTYRSARFHRPTFMTPAPNEYKVELGTVLSTHNKRLKDNIKNKHKHIWEPLEEPNLNYEQREKEIFNNIIDILDENHVPDKKRKLTIHDVSGIKIVQRPIKDSKPVKYSIDNPKLLRTFLYRHDMPHYF